MKILVCSDGSEKSNEALDKAAEIAKFYPESEVSVIHVYSDIDMNVVPELGPSRLSRKSFDEHKKGKEILEKAEKRMAEKDIKVKPILVMGTPSQAIAKVANQGGYDLLVIGSRGLGGLKKLILGSVSNAVLNEVKCDVLVVK
ncbi:MAG TPA: universal stress protein [Firmicutes bacterium]|nr:universal stress protein [Bacillota bacterium]